VCLDYAVNQNTLLLMLESRNTTQPRKPTVLTSADVNNHTLEDVVMPLPGYDVIYPANQVGGWYQELLLQDGFVDSSTLQHKIRSVLLVLCAQVQPNTLMAWF